MTLLRVGVVVNLTIGLIAIFQVAITWLGIDELAAYTISLFAMSCFSGLIVALGILKKYTVGE